MQTPTFLTPALLLLGLSGLTTSAFAAGDKVAICHIPPGNPENVQILSIAPFAVQKHIDRHGDLTHSPVRSVSAARLGPNARARTLSATRRSRCW